MQFTVETAEPADAEEMADVHVRTWREAYAGLVDPAFLAGLRTEPRLRMWSTLLLRPDPERGSIVRVARSQDRALIGFASLTLRPWPPAPDAEGPTSAGSLPPPAEPGNPDRAAGTDVANTDPGAELRTLYVIQDWWDRGVGRALLQSVLREADARGVRWVDLWVLEANTRARRFYERAGFALDGGWQSEEIATGVFLDEVRYRGDLENLPRRG